MSPVGDYLPNFELENNPISDVMQVAHHYFENGLAYFTRRVNRSISMACANGEVAPFVGHNSYVTHLILMAK
jgi:hypothetical protein